MVRVAEDYRFVEMDFGDGEIVTLPRSTWRFPGTGISNWEDDSIHAIEDARVFGELDRIASL